MSNVLVLGAHFVSKEIAQDIIIQFNNQDFARGHHQRRIDKIQGSKLTEKN